MRQNAATLERLRRTFEVCLKQPRGHKGEHRGLPEVELGAAGEGALRPEETLHRSDREAGRDPHACVRHVCIRVRRAVQEHVEQHREQERAVARVTLATDQRCKHVLARAWWWGRRDVGRSGGGGTAVVRLHRVLLLVLLVFLVLLRARHPCSSRRRRVGFRG